MGFALSVALITGILIFFSVIFKPSIKVGRFHFGTYGLISLIGALFILCFQILPWEILSQKLFDSNGMNPFKILILFFSMTFLSIILDELGFFKFLALRLLEKKQKGQIRLFLKLYLIVSLLTIVTSNDIIILTFTPLICCFAKKAKINPLPYLFCEFFAANTWSMCLIIGNPTNIYLATSAKISFFAYFKVMILPTILAGSVSVFLLLFIFRKSLKEEPRQNESSDIILNKPLLIMAVLHLAFCIILLAISSYLNLEMWLITFCFAISLLLMICVYHCITKTRPIYLTRSLFRLPYELIPFLLSMFVLVLSLEYTGVTNKLASVLNASNPILTIGPSSFLTANFINNIPMSILYEAILRPEFFSAKNYLLGIYSAIIGSNIGAYFTPVGALAGLMWMSILKIYDINISFKTFVKHGIMVAIPTLLVSLGGLWLVSFFL